MNLVEKAIEIVGSARALALAIDVPIQSVYFWRSGDRRIPSDYCPSIERITKGAVRCEDLRPDIEWDVLRKPAKKKAVA